RDSRIRGEKGIKKTKLVFFTNEVEKYMHASDLIITKPGGLTVSEALACNVPLAVFDAIPGQEEDNADFLMTHDMAVRIRKGDDCAAMISQLLSDREKLEKMRESCESFDKSQSARNIFSLINELLEKRKI
ncbi:MAG TPA: galactosyldiacylglycerol synthase, partial [Ruminococcaceae bacterium]|nr:galactosyldiacylglycerol synthase [Oscillospiraceae bacterium]